MSEFFHLSFDHLSFEILLFYLLIYVTVIILCLWVLLHLTAITALVKRDIWGILDGRGRSVMAKCQGRKKGTGGLLYCCVSLWLLPQRLKCITPLFKNPSRDLLCMSQYWEESSESHGEITYEFTAHLPPTPFIRDLFHIIYCNSFRCKWLSPNNQ